MKIKQEYQHSGIWTVEKSKTYSGAGEYNNWSKNELLNGLNNKIYQDDNSGSRRTGNLIHFGTGSKGSKQGYDT